MSRRLRLLATALVAGAAVAGIALVQGRDAEPASAPPPAAPLDADPPVLVAPEDKLALPPGPAAFVVTFQTQGYVQVQFATDETFDGDARVCDSGWYSSGFHSESSWTLPGPIGFSAATCRLQPGPHFWRARWAPGSGGGAAPPDASTPATDWSEPSSFLVQNAAEPAPSGWHHKGTKG